jgi:hypothetical protein
MFTKFAKVAAAAAMMAMLAACAGSVSKPTALQALTAEQLKEVHIGKINTSAADGVRMTKGDFTLISEKVQTYIEEGNPGVMVDPSTGDALTLKMHFTKFDRGSAIARGIMIGLGQIKIHATVTLEKPDGTVVGKYQVKKTFALGGLVGAATSVEDVEEGFAKSVAEIVKAEVIKK